VDSEARRLSCRAGLLESRNDSGRARARELRAPGPAGDARRAGRARRPGEVDVELAFDERLTQQHGYLHAGALTAALDSACGYAALTLMPEEAAVLSVEFKVNLLAPAEGERFLARGRVVRAGRTLTVCRGDAVAFAGDDERHVATMVATMMALGPRDGQAG
jgi:uncharacterized protein (TIGR00369 family)